MKWHAYDEVEGCGILELEHRIDDRGFFMEMFNKQEIAKNGIPLPWSFAQENLSYSHAGVLRGFHVQTNNPQGKLVTCLGGRIMDVCLDLRPQSPTFMSMTRVILDPEKPMSFWLPPGTAHAFIALEPSFVHYLCSTVYDPASDTGIDACSPEVAMVWPPGKFIRSERDRALPKLVEYLGGLG